MRRIDVCQALAICLLGNRSVAGEFPAKEPLASHPTFRNLHQVDFVRPGLGRAMPSLTTEGALPWFRRMASESVSRYRLLLAELPKTLGDNMDATLFGVLTDTDHGLELWSPNWKRFYRGQGDTQPFRVTYEAFRVARWQLRTAGDPASLRDAFVHSIPSAVSFDKSIEPEMRVYTSEFDRAFSTELRNWLGTEFFAPTIDALAFLDWVSGPTGKQTLERAPIAATRSAACALLEALTALPCGPVGQVVSPKNHQAYHQPA